MYAEKVVFEKEIEVQGTKAGIIDILENYRFIRCQRETWDVLTKGAGIDPGNAISSILDWAPHNGRMALIMYPGQDPGKIRLKIQATEWIYPEGESPPEETEIPDSIDYAEGFIEALHDAISAWLPPEPAIDAPIEAWLKYRDRLIEEKGLILLYGEIARKTNRSEQTVKNAASTLRRKKGVSKN